MISVVIPVLDEEETIADALASLRADPTPHEVVVVDGGSRDATCAIAARSGARVVTAAQGRGSQMNAGARASGGEILLFLHADLRLAPGALAAVSAALTDARVVGGGFLKTYDGGSAWLRATGLWLNQVRSRRLGRLVGTQAIFVRRGVFATLGGYREWPLMEDVDFSDRLREQGRVAVLAPRVRASARRYRRRGVLRQIAVNAVVLGLYRLGVHPARLGRLYEGLS